MDNKYQSSVIAEMQAFLDQNGFKGTKDGIFEGEKGKIKVEYSEERQMYTLDVAIKTEDGFGEFKEENAWLFDDSQTEKDAAAVGIDFTEDLRKIFDIKRENVSNSANIELPSAKKGGSYDISSFAKKVLDVFPQYKENYKEHIAKYGNFLYMEFFSNTLVVQLKEILENGTKKQIKKLFDLMENGFINGDGETSNIVVACLSAAASKDEATKSALLSILEENTHLRDSVNAFIPYLKSNKKLYNALIK